MTYLFSPDKKVGILRVNTFVTNSFGITRKQLYSKTRFREVAQARFVAFYLLTSRFHFSVSELSRIYNLDPSTVKNGIRRVNSLDMKDEVNRQFEKSYPHP